MQLRYRKESWGCLECQAKSFFMRQASSVPILFHSLYIQLISAVSKFLLGTQVYFLLLLPRHLVQAVGTESTQGYKRCVQSSSTSRATRALEEEKYVLPLCRSCSYRQEKNKIQSPQVLFLLSQLLYQC